MYQIAMSGDAWANFMLNEVSNSQIDPNPHANSNNFPVFAISCNLGTIQTTQNPVVWVVGYTTDPTISYPDLLSGAPLTSRSLYYKTKYLNDSNEALASIDSNPLGR